MSKAADAVVTPIPALVTRISCDFNVLVPISISPKLLDIAPESAK